MALKDSIEELIGSVHSCGTRDGVKELEGLFSKKQKELGGNITPMMAIRVKDAINTRYQQFDDMESERKEMEANKKKDEEAAKIQAKMDEGLFVSTDVEFFNHEVPLDETDISAVCIMDMNARVPTKGHRELLGMIEDAADHVGATARVYVNEGGVADKRQLIESIAPESVKVLEKDYMVAELDRLRDLGATRVFAFVPESRVAEYRRYGRHFLREGQRFEVVTYNNKTRSAEMVEFVRKDDFDSFLEASPFEPAMSEVIYESLLFDYVEAETE
ncbi:DNA helicase [Vibrio phage D479]